MAHNITCAQSRAARCECSCAGSRHGEVYRGVLTLDEEKARLRRSRDDEVTICAWCRQPLTWHDGAWRHPGGGRYVRRCDDCGREWDDDDVRQTCPACGGRRLRDRHAALPFSRRGGRKR